MGRHLTNRVPHGRGCCAADLTQEKPVTGPDPVNCARPGDPRGRAASRRRFRERSARKPGGTVRHHLVTSARCTGCRQTPPAPARGPATARPCLRRRGRTRSLSSGRRTILRGWRAATQPSLSGAFRRIVWTADQSPIVSTAQLIAYGDSPLTLSRWPTAAWPSVGPAFRGFRRTALCGGEDVGPLRGARSNSRRKSELGPYDLSFGGIAGAPGLRELRDEEESAAALVGGGRLPQAR